MKNPISAYDAIADANRRKILDMLRHRSLPAGDIARRFANLSRPAVSKHLGVLRRSNLVAAHRRGRQIRYSLRAGPLRDVDRWLRRYEALWDGHLQSFKP